MENRTTSKLVTFRRSFTLSGLGDVQPPGTYSVRMEEEMLDTLSFIGWRQIATTLQIRSGGVTEYFVVDGQDLRAAQLRDSSQSNDPPPAPPVARSRPVRAILHLGGGST